MKQLFLFACCCLLSVCSYGQQQLGQRPRVKSPVINADGTVTFNFYDPSASSVSVNGDFEEIRNQRLQMTRQENGVWTATTSAPLAPELYSYSLNVDGQRLIDPANSYVNRDIATLSNIFIVSRSADDKGHLYSVNDVPHGTLSRVWYDSPTLGQQRRMTVYLPAAYDGKKQFPVMYLLHGHGGDETAWGDLGRASQIMDNLIAEGKCVPMIVVMPNGNPTCNAAPGWWHEGMYTPDGNAFRDRGAKASMEESFMDIVNFVDSRYQTIRDRSARAVTGLSMGGGHTFGISRLYPETFDYYGLQSAACRMPQDRAAFDQQMSRLFASKPKLYWIAIGKDDFLMQMNTQLRQYLDEKGYTYEYYENDGGHIWRNWRIYLSMFAQKLFKDLVSQPRISIFFDHVAEISRQEKISITEAAQRVRQLGVEGIDVRVGMPDSQLRMLDSLGFQHASAIADINFIRGAQPEATRRALDFMHRYNYTRLLIIPGLLPEDASPALMDEVCERVAAFVREAAEEGIDVMVEDYDNPRSPCYNTSTLDRLFAASPRLNHVFDTGNYLFCGEEVMTALRHFRQRIHHVHLKDRKAQRDYASLPVGTGVVPLKDVLSELLHSGYDGWFTVEHFGAPSMLEYTRQSVANIRAAWGAQ